MHVWLARAWEYDGAAVDRKVLQVTYVLVVASGISVVLRAS